MGHAELLAGVVGFGLGIMAVCGGLLIVAGWALASIRDHEKNHDG